MVSFESWGMYIRWYWSWGVYIRLGLVLGGVICTSLYFLTTLVHFLYKNIIFALFLLSMCSIPGHKSVITLEESCTYMFIFMLQISVLVLSMLTCVVLLPYIHGLYTKNILQLKCYQFSSGYDNKGSHLETEGRRSTRTLQTFSQVNQLFSHHD